MPKNREQSAPVKTENKKHPKPYERCDKIDTTASSSASAPAMNGAHSSKSADAMEAPLAAPLLEFSAALPPRSQNSKRRKRKKSNHPENNDSVEPEAETTEEHAPVPTVLQPSRTSKENATASSSKPPAETAEQILKRHKGEHMSGGSTASTSALQTALDIEKVEHAETKRRLRVASEKSHDEVLGLKRAYAELQGVLEETKSKLEAQTTEIESQSKMIVDHTKHHDDIKDGLSCGVCFEIFDDPHVVACGHSACRKCLIQWFRSSNAYRAEEIDAVIEGDDLRYRTKICHMCREPVLRRPIRMFALQSVIETLGLAPRHHDEERNDDHWALTFPPDPVSYMITDEADGVNRCPACGCEVVGGNCEGCNAEFSDEDGEGIDDLYDFDGLDTDGEWDGIGAVDPGDAPPPNAMDFYGHFIDGIADEEQEGDWHDEEDHDFDDEDEGDDDLGDWGNRAGRHLFPPQVPRFAMTDSEDSDIMPPAPEDILRLGLDRNRWGSDESDDEDFLGRRRQFSPPAPRRRGGIRDRGVIDLRSETPEPAPRRHRGAPVPATQEEEEEGDYESSFIDDDDSSVIDIDSEDSEAEEAEVDAAPALSAADDSEPDVPTIDQLRQRRAARFAGARSVTPPADLPVTRPGRAGRPAAARSITPQPESPPTRAVRAPARRRRVISVSDSDE